MAGQGCAEEYYDRARAGTDVRKNLILLRDSLKDEEERRAFMYALGGDFSYLEQCLLSDDPKIRRNAALILGYTEDEDVLPALVRAWKKEETLYIREDYLKAMEKMDFRLYLPELCERLRELSNIASSASGQGSDGAGNALWDNDKHLAAEMQHLLRMTERFQKRTKHEYDRTMQMPDILLVCNRAQCGVTARQVHTGEVHEMNGAVRVRRGSMDEIMGIRTWSECLFLIPGARPVPSAPKEAAEALHSLRIGTFLCRLHGIQPMPDAKRGQVSGFRYRVELKGKQIPQEKKGAFIRAFSSRLDYLEQGLVENSDSDYEAEIRLIERSDGTLVPMLKLFTLRDSRFAYRREVTAQSMSPVNAALVCELARPCLRADAQVLDPFCGSGTLLIERTLALGAKDVYGIDRYGDAVKKARVNAQKLHRINFINRDFFDFQHDYLFDEVITELPSLRPDEREAFMERFTDRCRLLTSEDAVLAAVTDSADILERAAEADGFRRVQRDLLNERTKTCLLIFKKEPEGVSARE